MSRNLLRDLPHNLSQEVFEPLLQASTFRLERIISAGQATPPGQWYDQDQDEWVILLAGAARLRFEDETAQRELGPGDCVQIAGIEWNGLRQPRPPFGSPCIIEQDD